MYQLFEQDWSKYRDQKISKNIEKILKQCNLAFNIKDNLHCFIWILENASLFMTQDWYELVDEFNTTIAFVSQYKDTPLPWDWNDCYDNDNQDDNYRQKLTDDFIKHNLHFPWDWTRLSYNYNYKNLTFEFVSEFIDKPWNWQNLSQRKNITNDILNDHLHFPWDWECISFLDMLSFDFVAEHYELSWKWSYLSRHDKLTMDFVRNHIHFPWDWECMSRFDKLSFDFVSKFIDKPWDWDYLSKHEHLTIDFVNDHLDFPWNWHIMSMLNIITFEFVYNNPEKTWNWRGLFCCNATFMYGFYHDYLCNKDEINYIIINNIQIQINNEDLFNILLSNYRYVTIDFIEKHIDKKWDWKALASNSNITPEFIEKHIDKPWILYDTTILHDNLNITHDIISNNLDQLDFETLNNNCTEIPLYIIEKYNDKPWDWKKLSRNHNITSEFFEKNYDKPWDFIQLSYHPNITLNFIEQTIDKEWLWGARRKADDDGLSEHPVMTLEFIEKHIDKNWNWKYLAQYNPNITSEFIEKHIDFCSYFIFTHHLWLTLDFIERPIFFKDITNLNKLNKLQYSLVYLFKNTFLTDKKKMLHKYHFINPNGIFNELIQTICRPPTYDGDETDYEIKITNFINKMNNLGFDFY